MSDRHPFPYRKFTLVIVIETGELGVVQADEIDGSVSVDVDESGLRVFSHDEISPRVCKRSAASYDAVTTG